MIWKSVCSVHYARDLPFPPVPPPSAPHPLHPALPWRQSLHCNRLTWSLVSSWVCPLGSPYRRSEGRSTARSVSVFLCFLHAGWPWAGCIDPPKAKGHSSCEGDLFHTLPPNSVQPLIPLCLQVVTPGMTSPGHLSLLCGCPTPAHIS